ncbi:MAG: YdcF family protein [Flaviaesturariibacter sp.]|nr:YdcF family protein [Flaviaesturariibacter sp.]
MFVLLKVLLFLFRPLIWVIILFLLAAFTKKPVRKRRLFIATLIALLFFSNPFIINQLITAYEPSPMELTPTSKYAAGIVLGGFVSYNLKEDKGYFNPASDRFIQTVLLYRKGAIQKIIIAAGNGYIVKHHFKEADFIKQHLVELGIPAADIYTDGESKNTLQNAVNAKKIIDSLYLPGPYLLISSAMHLPRAQKVFTKQGMPVVLYPCDFISKGGGNNFMEDVLLPSATALRNWDNFIKELLGTIVYKFTGKG